MPELPEVEIIRQSLNKKIKQKKVKKVVVRNRNLRFKIPFSFKKTLENQKILEVKRFSKYIILHLSNNCYCLFHLGMSGTVHLINYRQTKNLTNTSFYSSPILPVKHSHVEIIFDSFKIIYNDPRRFGFFQIFKSLDLLKKKFVKYGPEPFSSKFNLNYVTSFFKGKKKIIKNFLLDQNFVSGIGNIYANEILYFSKINPNKKAYLLKKKECVKIITNSKKILLAAIKKGGSTIRNFKNISGKKGNFQKKFKVYARAGLKCQRTKCRGIIQKKFLSNRSTFYCDFCQKI
ncbi:bifunctional DNA-formamidopyrimidine glycosylase/DNA-(apurinic or apyrimidinic site) lyase [Candidatus Pelagibacter sp.]|nr:bifunctional DNA-formamidopyrimidine glycosylase/DNA-(apurinic or apyrimidinic site) lyase [Candidatus Pelagibacter sp.]